ncbi:MAG TPA: SRPBCC family protein [Chitinophagales bacterium]|nr:SRPBCC family protein [Chitinophagales bacterium]
MSTDHIARASIRINASPEEVWKALTTPKIIKQYFFDTNAVSDWKAGSKLEWKGSWEGTEYIDKGVILESDPPRRFKYTYLSSMSGKEDKPENYSQVTYELEPKNGGTELIVSQTGNAIQEAAEHSQQNWISVFNGMKEILEKQSA